MPTIQDKRSPTRQSRYGDGARVILGADGLPARRSLGEGGPILRAEYDAVGSSNRRRLPATVLRDEDRELLPQSRGAMVAAARDIRRNYSIAAWAIRKHLDYVSTFTFQSRTGDADLDARIENLMAWWGRRENCDVAARHPLPRLTRLLEAHRVVDGDVFLLKLLDGRVQGIEGDRVRNPWGGLPPGVAAGSLLHGVQVDSPGKALAYSVCRRIGGTGFEFERLLPAAWVYHHGYFDRLDQVRGVTPLSSALNDFRDCYEAKDYALAKMKISQLFGLIFYREAAEEMGVVTPQASADAASAGTSTPEYYEVDLGKGPFKVELDPGDRAEWLETKSPAAETLAFFQAMIEAALKSLDLPMSFYDGSRTNFFGSRAELNHYLAGAAIKRRDIQDMLGWLTAWRLGMSVDRGLLKLPAGLKLRDLKSEWVHAGLPWWNPQQEVNADIQALAGALTSRQRVTKERGEDWYEIVDELAAEQKTLAERGLPTDLKPAHVLVQDMAGEGKGKDA